MTIKSRIILFQLVVALALAAMATMAYVGIQATTQGLERVQWARQQLDAATRLAVSANRFSEQIAELLLIGEPERPDFDNARYEVNVLLRELEELTQEEIASLTNPAEQEMERRELALIEQMRALLREIDRAVERLLMLDQEGRRDEAIALFRSEIENRLDAEFERLIATALAGEQEEAAHVDADAERLSRWLSLGTLAALLVFLATTIAAGLHFYRSIAPPIKALTDGAQALGRGEMDHRIAYRGRDELGLMAERFNQMADQLRDQQARLLERQSDLAGQVADRTKQLQEANRRLTEIDQQRIRFLADVSHELRTPLTVLRGEAEVTLRGASKPESAYREALALIVAQATDMGRLVDDLLFLARSEAEDIRFDLQRIDMAAIVRRVVEQVSVLGRTRDIGIAVEISGPNLAVCGDPRRLKQAMLIVLDNAVKYADPGTEVNVRLNRDVDEVELVVQDAGPGIPPEEVPHVFDRFFRGTNTKASAGGGSGLGLPIARWIIDRHEGTISLSSTPGQGTEVRIRLPAMIEGETSTRREGESGGEHSADNVIEFGKLARGLPAPGRNG